MCFAIYVNLESSPFSGTDDIMRLSYSADHPFTVGFEDQMMRLQREYLSVHHPDTPGALDDAPDATALMLVGAAKGAVGDIVFV